jgi:quinol monooxygenase YgiN
MSAAKVMAPAALVVAHEVEDFDRWKKAFDADEGNRKSAGMLGHHINRGRDNPNQVSVFMALTDVARAKAFASSDTLKRSMAEAGIKGPPQVIWMKPVSENIVWDRQLPAIMVTHPVADFAAWLATYQGAGAMLKAAGIIGHAVNQSMDDPKMVVVYNQAETHAALEAFVANPDLKAAMQKSGVTGVPTFTYHTGGWAKTY